MDGIFVIGALSEANKAVVYQRLGCFQLVKLLAFSLSSQRGSLRAILQLCP
jgi:hypothetical protein